MKICFVVPYPPPYGGIANWTKLVSDYIDKEEANIEIIPLNTAPVKRSTEGRNLWNRVVDSGMDMLKQNRRLKRILETENVDVIHMITSGQLALIRDLLLMNTAKRFGVPCVYHIRFGRIPDIMKRKTLEWRFLKRAIETAAGIIVIDLESDKAIRETLPRANIYRLPNPIDISEMPRPAEIKRKIIIFVGWVVKTKGIEELLRAWNWVGLKHPDYELHIVDPMKDEYKTQLFSMIRVKNVVFCGEMEHEKVLKKVSESAAFVLPSYTEGFPNSILEAMAMKTPVIATKVGAIPEMLSGCCGILTEKKSIGELEQALEKLICHPEKGETIAENAYVKACEKYDIVKILSQYKEIWKEVI